MSEQEMDEKATMKVSDDVFGEPEVGEALVEPQGEVGLDEDLVTAEEYEQLLSRHVFQKAGEWAADAMFTMSDAKLVKADRERPGGLQVTLMVLTPPAGVQPPKGGFGPVVITFPKFGKEAPDNKRKQEEIARREKSLLHKALGGVMVKTEDGRLRLDEAIIQSKGRRVMAQVKHELEKDKETKRKVPGGRVYERVGNFRPVAG